MYYILFGSIVTKWEIRSIEIMQDDIVFHCGIVYFLKHDLGKTIFLTREEAETALNATALKNKTIKQKEKETMLNKKVIIRADRAGVFFGTLKEKNGNEATLTDCRRLWYWEGAASLSQLAVDGTCNAKECKFTVTVPEITILGVIEIIPCTDKAVKSIEGVKEWKR